MTGSPRGIAAAVGALVVLQIPAVHAQSAPQAVARVASLASGSIGGVVQEELGAPVVGATVSALGVRSAVVVTDQQGRFEFRSLPPGPYLLRAHVEGFAASRGQVVDVRANARTSSTLALRALRHIDVKPSSPELPVLAAGFGGARQPAEAEPDAPATAGADRQAADRAPASDALPPADDDHGELAWRLRHLRRSILKEVTMPGELLAGDDVSSDAGAFDPLAVRLARSSPGLSEILFAGVPLTGQFNLLTTGSFDTPKQLFASDNFSRSIASVALAAPIGDYADWSMRGALTQGDISSWFVSGAYTTRVPARHRYDLGLSYSTQRYDGGNLAALREVTDGSRNVGAVYGFDTFALTPALAITYGARFSRYDYLDTPGLFSPRAEVTLSLAKHVRVSALASSLAVAPGAEEFLPPIHAGVWLPPQRTFSSIVEGRPLIPQRTDHLAVAAERDFGTATVSVRAFHQRITDQIVTVFGFEAPDTPATQLGHYVVGNAGDAEAAGWTAALRTPLASRVIGSVEYTLTRASWSKATDAEYLLLVAPSVELPAIHRAHDLATVVETNVPETATRILVIARVSRVVNDGAPAHEGDRSTYDSRFDIQVHQSLPFMDFSTARWEMLVAVRNTFHEAAIGSSLFDELLVVRPPKRIVGGLTLRF